MRALGHCSDPNASSLRPPPYSTIKLQSNCKSTAWHGSGRCVNFTFLMILANTLKHTNWNCSVSVSTGRILTTELKGQSIGKSPGEALIPGYRLTVNCFQEQMDSANLREMRWARRNKISGR